MLKLTRLTEHVWITDYEVRRDRPTLGYIYTKSQSIAIDAGHSKEHVQEFYDALSNAKLPLPERTILTHYHWDHTFGMHAVCGLSIAEERIQTHLKEILSQWNQFGEKEFKAMDEHIRAEYEHQPMLVKLADETFEDCMTIQMDDIKVQCFHVTSSHTDDATLIYLPEDKVLFFGDAMCGEYPEWKINSELMKQFIEAIEKIDFMYAVGGHWEPFTKEEFLETLSSDLSDIQ